MLDTAVILAGGRGLRLLPFTADKPKALVAVLNRPLIEWIILWLKQNGVTKIILSVDYKKEVLIKHLGNGSRLGVSVTYNDHTGVKETGGAFRNVLDRVKLPDVFFAMNGDQITDLPLNEFAAFHHHHQPIASLVACPLRVPFGIIETEGAHTATAFVEKPTFADKLMNTGIYIFTKGIVPHLPTDGAIERTTFADLAGKGSLKVFPYHGLFTTVNDQKDLEESEKILRTVNLKFI